MSGIEHLTDDEAADVEYYQKNFTDDQICKMADAGDPAGDPAADTIFHSIWDADKRQRISRQVSDEWAKQWEKTK